MEFKENNALSTFLNILFERYRANVPNVDKISQALVDRGVIGSADDIINDHVAFRTMGVPNLGIASFEKIFLAHGYTKRDYYFFEEKKLDAYWYAPPTPDYPRVFMSELRVKDLSKETQGLIEKYTQGIAYDPIDDVDLSDGNSIGEFLHKPLWSLPTKADYEALKQESEYAAWVIYNRYYLNHYTISVHNLKEGYNTLDNFNVFLEDLGVVLNTAGGKIKTSRDGLLLQSSCVSNMVEAAFADGEKLEISGSYVEFAERKVLPEFKHLKKEELRREHRREGFEAGNADKIFESTYSEQTDKI